MCGWVPPKCVCVRHISYQEHNFIKVKGYDIKRDKQIYHYEEK